MSGQDECGAKDGTQGGRPDRPAVQNRETAVLDMLQARAAGDKRALRGDAPKSMRAPTNQHPGAARADRRPSTERAGLEQATDSWREVPPAVAALGDARPALGLPAMAARPVDAARGEHGPTVDRSRHPEPKYTLPSYKGTSEQ
jgi:hypothetical protein